MFVDFKFQINQIMRTTNIYQVAELEPVLCPNICIIIYSRYVIK